MHPATFGIFGGSSILGTSTTSCEKRETLSSKEDNLERTVFWKQLIYSSLMVARRLYKSLLNPSSVFLLIIVEASWGGGSTTPPPKISTTISAMTLRLGTIVYDVKWWRHAKNDVMKPSGPENTRYWNLLWKTLTKQFWAIYLHLVWFDKNDVFDSFPA